LPKARSRGSPRSTLKQELRLRQKLAQKLKLKLKPLSPRERGWGEDSGARPE
jgi:hypothetical protein